MLNPKDPAQVLHKTEAQKNILSEMGTDSIQTVLFNFKTTQSYNKDNLSI